ncbi:MAG TPA: ABC transporter substrate-binding protein, partial [Acetobacteraceae bacterium]|nr:ABC transporter substrate-binding protein [Acetobacteraceae bacterium]
LPLVAIATLTRASGYVIISLASHPVRDAADLRGKRAGIVAAGSATEFYLDIALQAGGVPRDSVERHVVGSTIGVFTLIEQGRLDCAVASVPVSEALMAAGAPVYVWNNDAAAPLPGRCIVTTRARVDAEADMLAACLRAIRASLRDLTGSAAGLDAAVARVAAAFGVPEARNVSAFTIQARSELALVARDEYGPSLRNPLDDWRTGCAALTRIGIDRIPDPASIVTDTVLARM